MTIKALAQDQAFFIGRWRFTLDSGGSAHMTVNATVFYSDGSHINLDDKTVSSVGDSVRGSFNFTCSQTLC